MTKFRTTGLAEHWLTQSEMWLAEMACSTLPPNAITDLRQNARAAVHEAILETEAAFFTQAKAALSELNASLFTNAEHARAKDILREIINKGSEC